jgi:uncharacterized protein YegP (UPF0339 family)
MAHRRGGGQATGYRSDSPLSSSVTATRTVEEKGEMAKFELYKDGKGEYRWRLKSGNGQIIATGGEGYTTKTGAINGIEAVKRDAGAANVDEQD